MPDNPESRIEELLRAYAAKRREELGAPLELDPATRRLLQAEVARLHPPRKAPPAAWWNSLAVLWPRLALGAVGVAALGICAWWLAPRGKEAMEMARNDASERPLTASRSLAESRHEDRSGVLPRSDRVMSDREADSKGPALNAPASPPPQSIPTRLPAVAPGTPTDLANAADKAKQLEQLAAARPTAPAAPAANGLAAPDRDLGGFKYSKSVAVTGGTLRADLAAQPPPSALNRLKSSPVRQVADAPAFGGAGQPGQENVQLRRMPTEQADPYYVTTQTALTAGASSLRADKDAFVEAAPTVASGTVSAGFFGMAGVAPSKQPAEKAASVATNATVFLDSTPAAQARSQAGLFDLTSARWSGLQTNALEGLDRTYGLSLAYEPTRMPAGKAQWGSSQSGSNQGYFGAIYSPLIPEIRPQPTRARSEAVSERISPGTPASLAEGAAYERKAASGTGGRVPAPAQVAATAKPEPSAAAASRFVGQKAAGATDVASGVRYHFVNTTRAAPELARAKALPPANALNAFDFERSGDRVSIADADGSVYEGSVVNERETGPWESGELFWMRQDGPSDSRRGNPVTREASKPGQPDRSVLAFQVAGTNRTLNQPVVMRGVIRYSGDASALGAASQPRARAAVPPATGPTSGRQLPRTVSAGSEVSDLQLDGRLRIGTNESDFRAVRRLPERK